MPFFDHENVRLHYRDTGGMKPAVLLLHAFPLHGEMFARQLEALEDRYRVIVPDLRGFGQSALPAASQPTRMTDLASDAVALLDHLGIGQVVLGGVSMGGYAAFAVLRLAPDRIRALVLADTQPLAEDPAGKARRRENAQRLMREGVQILVVELLPKLVGPSASAECRAQIEELIRACSPSAAAQASLGMVEREDARELLTRYAGPALFLVGEHDGISPPERVREMADLVRGSKLAVIPKAGHLANLEAPAGFNQALRAFLDALP